MLLAALQGSGLSAEQAPVPTAREAYLDCIRMAAEEPEKAKRLAEQWVAEDGGAAPRHCLSMAELRLGNASGASATLAAAARIAEAEGAPQTSALYAEAGNAALAGGEFARAEEFFGRALVALQRGQEAARAEIYVDRARAYAALGRLNNARADLFSATQDDPGSHSAWLLLAAAERRAGNSAGAESAIKEAIRLAPEDAGTLEEAARIATMAD